MTPWGALVPADGSSTLDWWVAAEDRWHTPAEEPSCRQRLIQGVPVVETAVRVPGGDAVQRIYAVADAGGLTVVEIENCSPAPFAVALSRRDLLTSRPPADVPVEGGAAPVDALVVPVGHRATARVALAHDGRGGGPLPGRLPSADQVVRGWLAQTSHAVRLHLPPVAPTVMLPTLRSQILLDGPGDPVEGAAFLVAVAELGRLGEDLESWVDDVAVVAEGIARWSREPPSLPWGADAGLAAAHEALTRVGDDRAADDAAALRRRLPPPEPTPIAPPQGPLALAWAQRRAVAGGPDALDLLPAPFPPAWAGQPIEVYGVPCGGVTVGVALRWHGHRPAVLWEADGPVRRVGCSGLAPSWSSAASTGEALLVVLEGFVQPTPEPTGSEGVSGRRGFRDLG